MQSPGEGPHKILKVGQVNMGGDGVQIPYCLGMGFINTNTIIWWIERHMIDLLSFPTALPRRAVGIRGYLTLVSWGM